MPQLPPIPGAVWGVSPTSKTDGAGVLFLSCFVGKSQRVYKLVAGAWVVVPLEADPTCAACLTLTPMGAATSPPGMTGRRRSGVSRTRAGCALRRAAGYRRATRRR